MKQWKARVNRTFNVLAILGWLIFAAAIIAAIFEM